MSLLGSRADGRNVQPSDIIDIFFSKLVDDNDSCAQKEYFLKAKQASIYEFQKRKTRKTINRCDISTGSNSLEGRFVSTLKKAGSPSEPAKARYATQRHRENYKNIIIRDSAVLKAFNIRTILSAAAVIEMRHFFLRCITGIPSKQKQTVEMRSLKNKTKWPHFILAKRSITVWVENVSLRSLWRWWLL